jgi:multiple sugar transport system permease protein
VVDITLMWRALLDSNYGLINQFLSVFGIKDIAWLRDEKYFMWGMILMGVWTGIGFSMILYSSSLTSINPLYYEAAEIDGANALQKFTKITLPLVSPTTFYLFIVGIIGGLQEFTRFQAINSINSNLVSITGPKDAGLTIVFYLYQKGFNTVGGLGSASAVSVILLVITGILTLINFYGSKKWVKQ